MGSVKVGIVGLITNSDHPRHHVRVDDDSGNTGGFLIYEWWEGSDGPNANNAFDSWVESREALESFFREGNWKVDWNAA